jgi:hypothetical protein
VGSFQTLLGPPRCGACWGNGGQRGFAGPERDTGVRGLKLGLVDDLVGSDLTVFPSGARTSDDAYDAWGVNCTQEPDVEVRGLEASWLCFCVRSQSSDASG